MNKNARSGGKWLLLAFAYLLYAGTAQAATFNERLDGLGAALARQVLESNDALMPENARLAWIFLPGDREPDALVIARPGRNDCAGSMPNRPCSAFIFKGLGRGQFQLATEFKQRLHALALEIVGNELKALYVTSDGGNTPVYRRYAFDGQAFVPSGEPVPVAQLQERRVVMLDDRNMGSFGDEGQAARNFPNAQARLAPFRLYVDSMSITERRQTNTLVFDSSFDVRMQTLQESLLGDAERLSVALPWPQTLELRLWSCVDWMVSRRFWEVEDRRLSRIGACAEPALFAFKQGIVRSAAGMTDLARYRLLRDVGIAYLLRAASQPLALRQALRSTHGDADTIFIGSVAGLLIGQQVRIQSLEQAAQAQAGLRQVSNRWFEKFEREQNHYLSKTPELRAFDAELDQAEAALACVRKTGVGCTGRRAELTARIQQMIKESLQP
jgi:hypothetical protein